MNLFHQIASGAKDLMLQYSPQQSRPLQSIVGAFGDVIN
jgi:hypothetical protein